MFLFLFLVLFDENLPKRNSEIVVRSGEHLNDFNQKTNFDMAGKIIKMPTYYMIVTSFKSYLFIFFSQAHYKGGKVAKTLTVYTTN